jgi:hypothetical protein
LGQSSSGTFFFSNALHTFCDVAPQLLALAGKEGRYINLGVAAGERMKVLDAGF